MIAATMGEARARATRSSLVRGGIARRSRRREMFAETAPMIVAGHADEQLLAVGGREGLVDAPGAARAGIGGIGCPVIASPAMCCPIRKR